MLKLEYEAYEPMAIKQMRSVQSMRTEAEGERNALRSSTCGLQHLSTVADGCVFSLLFVCVCDVQRAVRWYSIALAERHQVRHSASNR